jgi:N-acetylglucosamine-6-phosphate deacetylase
MIPDTIHVHPTVLDLAYRIAGADRFSIVTDAMAALGMPPGTFRLGGREVTVDETGCRLPGGLLAGSNLRLDAGVRNLAAATGRGTEMAVAAATTVPARLLGLADRGRITPGARADLTIVTPDFQTAGTIVDGRLVWTGPVLENRVPAWA